MDGLQTPVDAVECAQHHEYLLGVLAQHAGGTVDSQQVAYIELANKTDADLVTVDVEIHAGEVHLDDARAEVSHLTDGIGLDSGLRVLHHDHAVLVVGIGDGEGALGQSVEEGLLGIAVVLECLVIVEVVAGEVGEDASGELQSSDALLMNGV